MLVTTPRRPVKVRTDRKRDERRDLPPLRDRLAEPIPTHWAVWGIVALVGSNVAAAVLEPLPANPALPVPWFISLLDTVVVLAMLPALAGLLARRRWGMGLSLLAAGVTVAMVVGCPLSGHHHFGLWWVGEIAAFSAWAAVSLGGVRCRPDSRRAA